MTLRKVAALLAAFGLTVGLIGGGVGAVFQDQVTATETIHVGDFGCQITSASPAAASDGIAVDGKSVTYTAPTILSSAEGSAPFSFTVKNTGTIPALLSISHGGLPSPFMSLNDPIADLATDAGESHTYNVGLAWGVLGPQNEGGSLTITYTVGCSEVDHFTTFGSATVTESGGTYTIVSDANIDYPPYGMAPESGGVVLTSKTVGKFIGSVDYSFVSSGLVTDAPRFSIPINDGSSTFYVFIGANRCGAVSNVASTVGTGAACIVDTNNGTGPYANWDAFVAAHPTYTIAGLPFVIADGTQGTFIVSNITETVS